MKFRGVVVLNFTLLLLAQVFPATALADERDYDIKIDMNAADADKPDDIGGSEEFLISKK